MQEICKAEAVARTAVRIVQINNDSSASEICINLTIC